MALNPNQELPTPTSGEGMEAERKLLAVEKAPSFHCFLKRVMEAEQGLVKVNLGLIAAAVHAVFLDSGFVVGDGSGSLLPEGWASATSTVSVDYTLPPLLGRRDAKAVTLKFSLMQKYVLVYGFLCGENSGVHRLCLDVSMLAPFLIFVVNVMGGDQEKQILWLLKNVKDRISLPLMVDICDKNGLSLPPCFDQLPADLKLKILELLPGADVARIGCTSSEIRCLASNNELWKKKFAEEFRLFNGSAAESWKERFVRSWVMRKETYKRIKDEEFRRTLKISVEFPFRPQRFPIFGGSYELFQSIGGFGPNPWGLGYGFFCYSANRNILPQNNLSGHNAIFRR